MAKGVAPHQPNGTLPGENFPGSPTGAPYSPSYQQSPVGDTMDWVGDHSSSFWQHDEGTVRNSDGSYTTTYQNGSATTFYADGSTSTVNADGSTWVQNADGSGYGVDANGDVIFANGDGTGTITTPGPDGKTYDYGPTGIVSDNQSSGQDADAWAPSQPNESTMLASLLSSGSGGAVADFISILGSGKTSEELALAAALGPNSSSDLSFGSATPADLAEMGQAFDNAGLSSGVLPDTVVAALGYAQEHTSASDAAWTTTPVRSSTQADAASDFDFGNGTNYAGGQEVGQGPGQHTVTFPALERGQRNTPPLQPQKPRTFITIIISYGNPTKGLEQEFEWMLGSHTGLYIDNANDPTLGSGPVIFDPAGAYKDDAPGVRSTADTISGKDANLPDYLAYMDSDGTVSSVHSYSVTQDQADALLAAINNINGVIGPQCTIAVTEVLRDSGIFPGVDFDIPSHFDEWLNEQGVGSPFINF